MVGWGSGSESRWRASQQKIALAYGNCYNDFYFLFLDLVVGYGWVGSCTSTTISGGSAL